MTEEKRTPERPDLVLYTVEETAEILRVSIPTVYRYIREKGLRATKFSPRKTFIAREDLLEFVESHKTRQPPPTVSRGLVGETLQAPVDQPQPPVLSS